MAIARQRSRKGSFLGQFFAGAGALLVLTCALLLSSPAEACGGCFSPPQTAATSSFVTSHRMAFSISATRTVLWDQFSYNGEPEDFSWVLPVKPGAYIEEAHPAFLDALDQFTTPQVYSEATNCGGSVGNEGCGCLLGGMSASGDAENLAGDYSEGPSVVVVSQETVGPYDTAILRSTDDGALTNWLTNHGYEIQPNIQPIIKAYVDEGFDFLALRLSPGKGVQQMTPVRVITPEGDPQLPLRMVAAGIANEVDMTLFLIANSRRVIPDLLDAEIKPSEVTWDFAVSESDYASLVTEKLKLQNGHVHLTTFARPDGFWGTNNVVGGFGNSTNYYVEGGWATNLGELYFLNAGAEDQKMGLARLCATEAPFNSSIRVAAPARDESNGAGGAGGAGTTEPDVPSVGLAPGGLHCGTWSDIEAALIGHIPAETWLTRLDMRLPVSALARDCLVTSKEEQTVVEPLFTAGKDLNHPCPDARVAQANASIVRFPPAVFFLLLGLAWFTRRRNRTSS